jgi:hypothetical protein
MMPELYTRYFALLWEMNVLFSLGGREPIAPSEGINALLIGIVEVLSVARSYTLWLYFDHVSTSDNRPPNTRLESTTFPPLRSGNVTAWPTPGRSRWQASTLRIRPFFTAMSW